MIIVDATVEKLQMTSLACYPAKQEWSVFTTEPTPPVGDREEDDQEVVGFNKWMELIKDTNETHYLALHFLGELLLHGYLSSIPCDAEIERQLGEAHIHNGV